eukprot:TRINITY_DN21836_c0_g1_i1.p1 TRINITY_DN21836_c0_g1~~TRINITY_DN21836_c0_g1_i1.p1  ORF type:complete len:258 (+),score=47.46 TRINITY_DN21836_c0_g1_i1:21-794(+)
MAHLGEKNYARERYIRLSNEAKDVPSDFPRQKLLKGNGTKGRFVVVACGSFSPITFMHLRMFELARDYASYHGLNLLGGFISPVTDAYQKKGLVSAEHRVKMCQLATETSDWISVDPWESSKAEYFTTLPVLEHFYNSLNKDLPEDEEPIQVRLLCGADLLQSFNSPGVWAPEDISDIVEKFGLMVLERGSEVDCGALIYDNDALYRNQKNIYLMKQFLRNDISSTRLRQNIQRGLSIKYLTPDPVVDYIAQQKLWQ